MTYPSVTGALAGVVDVTALPPPRAITIDQGAHSGLVYTGSALLAGWAVVESTGAAAFRARLFDGLDAGGQELGGIGSPAGGASLVGGGPPLARLQRGLYVAADAGAFTGAVWLIPLAGAV